jgi:methylmalonyl-CoA epimerase
VLGIKNAILPIGDAVIELIEPLDQQQGPVAKFLQNRGEGVYMIALEVDDIDSAVQSLQDKGVRLLSADAESRAKGIPVFIHPQSTKGLLIELVQKA